MAKLITPLAMNVPIADEKGHPTPYFNRILEEISDAKVAASVIDALGGDPGGDRVVVWDDATGDLAFMTTSEALDFITGASHGDVLFRGSAGWQTLDPGTAGQVLQTNGAGSDPTWVDPATTTSTGERTLVTPVSGSFTYQGNASGSLLSFANGLQIRAPNNGSTYNARAALTSGAPASFANFTVTAKLLPTLPHNMGGGGASQLYIRNSSNGRMLILGEASNSNSAYWHRWQNDTTFNATISSATSDRRMLNYPWRKLVVSGSSVTPYFSIDGYCWESAGFAAEAYATYLTAAGGAADQVGFSCHTTSGNWNYSVCHSFEIS